MPTPVDLGAQARAIVAGMRHTCALLTTDHVWCWGSRDYGAVGDGAVRLLTAAPTLVEGS